MSRILPAILILGHPIAVLLSYCLLVPWPAADGSPRAALIPSLEGIAFPLLFSAVFLVIPELAAGVILALIYLVGLAYRVLVKRQSPGPLLDRFLIWLALAVISGFNLAFLARQWRQ